MATDTVLPTVAVLWILTGFLALPETLEAKFYPSECEHVFRNVCFEFVNETKTWFEARMSCEKRGGELLKVTNNAIRIFLENITSDGHSENSTWWLGNGMQGGSDGKKSNASEQNCTYMMPSPLQLDLTSECNHSRSFICTRNLQLSPNTKNSSGSSQAGRSRHRRSIESMKNYINDIFQLLEEADRQIEAMETTQGQPTNDNMDKFIQYLYDGTNKLSKTFAAENNVTIGRIINCSTAILLLATKKCDIESNPNKKDLFEHVFKIFRKVAELLGKDPLQQFVIKHRTGTLYQNTYTPHNIGHALVGSEREDEFVVLPSYSALHSAIEKQENIIAQMATFTNNPHPDNNITGIVCSVLLSDGKADIELKNLTEMVEIFMSQPGNNELSNSTVVLEKHTQSVTTVFVSDPNMTIIYSVRPSINVSLILTLTHESNTAVTSDTPRTILTPEGDYRWHITPTMLDDTTGNWHIKARPFNSSLEDTLTLEINSFMSKCLYWDIEVEDWISDGCVVGERTTPWMTHCLCNHLTLFGSSFFVMPNYVDVSRTAELFATVNENYVVLSLLCAFFGLYLITLLWACYADRRSRSKRKITLLEDNHPGAQYNYLIGVQTGHRKNAGTTANVTVKLIGSEGESETQTLTDPEKPVFERGSVDMFLLATAFPLGEVGNIRLQHDDSGGRPCWYINKVTVQDLQTRHVFHFFCDCWLSSDRGDRMTKKTFNAAKTNEIACFRNIFSSRTSTGFRDEHIWVSIVDPPSRSPFTRAQRVSCCMSLLLCTMAINIAFWNVPLDPNSRVIFVLGSLHVTWQEIMVGIQSGLLMFPINILIITIFRSIKPRMVTPKDDQKKIKPHAVTIPTILRETGEVVYLVSKSPRNKISEVPALESITDLCYTLDRVNLFLQLMQGECESEPHWVCCSRFLLACLCHLLMDLERLDGKSVPIPQDYQMALNVTNVLVRKAEMVYTSHLASCPPPVRRQKKKSDGCWLPWWCVFLGWFLLLSISAVSTYFTLLYGFAYGREKSIKWVISLGLSLFQSIFILQPLKVIGVAVFFALLLKPVSVEETEEVEQVLLEQKERCVLYSGRETL